MKKSKKIILTIICIISVLVVSSIPCFALTSDSQSISPETLYNYSQKNTTFSVPNGLRFYTMGFEENVNKYFYIEPDKKFSLSNTGSAGAYPRAGMVFYFNNLLRNDNIWVGRDRSNTYSSYSYGFYEIEFNFYIAPQLAYFNEKGLPTTLNGYRSLISQPSFYRDSSNGNFVSPISPVSSDLSQIKNSKTFVTNITYSGRSGGRFGNPAQIAERYKVRLIVPAFEGLYAFDMSLSLPIYTSSLNGSTKYDLQISDLYINYYTNPDDIENFLYIPDFASSFQQIQNTEDFFNDNLNESLNDFKNIGTEMVSYLQDDLLPAFAIWNQYVSDILDLKPIRILLIFSIAIGIFTFVVSATNLVLDAHTKFTIDKDKDK